MLKSDGEHHRALQVNEKSRLLKELMPGLAPTEEPQEGHNTIQGFKVESLMARLAELEAKLAVEEAFDWEAEFKIAQQDQSLADQVHNPKNLSKNARRQVMKKTKIAFGIKIAEIKKERARHKAIMTDLRESIATLKWHLQSPEEKLEEIKEKKEELLRKRDLLAVRMAHLKGGGISHDKAKQAPHRPVVQAPKAGSVASGQEHKTEVNSSIPGCNHLDEPSPTAHGRIDPSSLHLPKGVTFIDDELTVDINVPARQLRKQIYAMQDRLKSFYPRLDKLPFDINKPLLKTKKHLLKTWLKILVNRYRAKIGPDADARPKGVTADGFKSLSTQKVGCRLLKDEAADRMAKTRNGAFSETRGATVTAAEMQQIEHKEQAKKQEQAKKVETNDSRDEDFDAFVSVLQDKTPTTLSSSGQVADTEDFEAGKEAAHEQQLSPQNSQELGSAVQEHNVRAVELGWGDESDVKAARAYTATRTPSTSSAKQTHPHLEDNDLRAPGAMTQFKAPGLIPKDLKDSYDEDVDVSKKSRTEQKTNKKSTATGNLFRRLPSKETNRMRLPGALGRFNDQPSPAKPFERSYSTSPHPPHDANRMPTSVRPEPQDSKRDTVATPTSPPPQPHLPHLTATGSAHMVSISSKAHTTRTAIAVGTVYFSNPTPLTLITANALKKGDVLSVSRIAGIMAAKKCPDIVPLCHPIPLTHVGVELRTFSAEAAPAAKLPDDLGHGGVQIECTVACTGATGVEMEALTAVMGTALSVVDMCKAVDKFQRIGDVRVVLKEGGKSGVWREESWRSWQGE